MGQNLFEELSAPKYQTGLLEQYSQLYWSAGRNSYWSQREYFINEIAESIYVHFHLLLTTFAPQKHIPKQFHALGSSQRTQQATQTQRRKRWCNATLDS